MLSLHTIGQSTLPRRCALLRLCTAQMCPFEVVYGFKPLTPLDLLPLPLLERANMEASKQADYVKKIHMQTKQEIEKKSEYYAAKANKNCKKVIFEPGGFTIRRKNFLRSEVPSCCPEVMVHSRFLQE